VEHEITPPGLAKAPLVAVVDDDPDIVELVAVHLKKTGMKVREFLDAESFSRFLRQDVPDLVLLDLMLPDADGVEVCKFLRRSERLSAVPVIMLTAKADEVDRVLGLEIGADDYVTKPFSPKELVARAKAVLRRTGPQAPRTHRVEIGGILTIDLQTHQVAVEGRTVEVTSVEFRILEFLASKTGWVFSRDRTVDVHVRHLREKLGKASGLLKNVRGAGYKLEA
jgi:DNA-binding response OmpR family regulator